MSLAGTVVPYSYVTAPSEVMVDPAHFVESYL